MRISTILPILLIYLLAIQLVSCSREAVPEPELPETPSVFDGSQFRFSLIQEEVFGKPVVLLGSKNANAVMAFYRELDGQELTFSALEAALPALMEDNLGNRYNLLGEVMEGPDTGRKLESPNAGMGFWFAYGALYPGVDLFGRGTTTFQIEMDSLEGWAIPINTVAAGAGFDAIPALDNPPFIQFEERISTGNTDNEASENFFIDNDDLVIVVSINGDVKVYPHAILDWHEVINDEVGGLPITVTYCPLTGTAKVWERPNDNADYHFGVSGLLYNSNVLPFDRGSESFWLQLEARSVFGPKQGAERPLVPFLETTLGTATILWSDFQILSEETGIDRDYRQYPYGDYRTNNLLAYPIAFNDDRLHPKERVFGIISEGKVKAYRLDEF